MLTARARSQWLIGIVAVSFGLGSCRDRQNDFTLDEFAAASGAHFWKIRIPADLKVDESLVTAWFRSGKYVATDNALQNFAPGSIAKAFVFKDEKVARMKFTVLGQTRDGTPMSTMSNIQPLEGYTVQTFHSPGGVLTEGDTMLTINGNERPLDDICELRLVRWRSDAPAREGL